MKSWVMLSAFILVVSGCSLISNRHLYEVRMTNGTLLYAENQPELRDGAYVFYDVDGQQYVINRSLVLYVETADFSR